MQIFARYPLYLLCLVSMVVQANPELPIRFKTGEVLVMKNTYTLADIAVLDKLNDQDRARLSNIEIGKSPKSTYVTQVSRHLVSARLERVLPGIHKSLRWSGEQRVNVRAGGVALDTNSLLHLAEKAMHDHLSRVYDEFNIEVLSDVGDVIVPLGTVTLETIIKQAEKISKRTLVWLDIYVDKQHVQTVPIWFSVQAYASILVASENLLRHQHLDSDDFYLAYKDIAGFSDKPLTSIENVAGRRLIKSLIQGDVLLESRLEKIPAVTKGAMITVQTTVGDIALETRGIAMNDADIEQRVGVQNSNKTASYFATVIKQGVVKVD